MRKKLIAGAAVLALLMSAPQVKAEDDIVVFGGEFEEEKPAPKKTPEPIREMPPEEINKPFEEPTPIDSRDEDLGTRDESTDETAQVDSRDEPAQIEQLDEPPLKPAEESEEPTVEKPPVEQIDEPPFQPVDEPEEPAQVEQPDDDNFGDELIFDDLNNLPEQVPVEESLESPTENPQSIDEPPAQIETPVVEPVTPTEIERPFEKPTRVASEEPIIVVPPTPQPPTPQLPMPEYTPPQPVAREEPARKPVVQKTTPRQQIQPRRTQQNQNLKELQPRFIKLAVDDTYTYYLDKESVQWKKMPYSTSEYIADVWIRMIEREPAQLEDDMAAYGADNFNAEVTLAAEQGYRYSPDDLAVLKNQGYVLEHYYLRPKTNQIQFLCELEVFGRPQNTINERAYDYKNWENLVPGSVESVIYATVIKIIGKSKATERGHMTFIDMLEEYGRISLR